MQKRRCFEQNEPQKSQRMWLTCYSKPFKDHKKKRQVWAGIWDYAHLSGFVFIPQLGSNKMFLLILLKDPKVFPAKVCGMVAVEHLAWATSTWLHQLFFVGSSWSRRYLSQIKRAMPCLVDFYVSRASFGYRKSHEWKCCSFECDGKICRRTKSSGKKSLSCTFVSVFFDL